MTAESAYDLTPALAQSWSAWAQSVLIEGLFRSRRWQRSEIAFQGGTALHLVHGSPRFSEDLDFLLAEGLAIEPCMQTAVTFMRRQAAVDFAGDPPTIRLHVGRATQTLQKNPASYEVRVTPGGKKTAVRVKAEFYEPPESAMPAYDAVVGTTRPPALPSLAVRVRPVTVSVGSLGAIYRDKLVALALREVPALRDVFDLWWIHTQMPVTERDAPGLLTNLAGHFAMYPRAGGIEAWREALDACRTRLAQPQIVEQLRAVLPQWMGVREAGLFDNTALEEMQGYVLHALTRALDALAPAPPSAVPQSRLRAGPHS